MKTQHFLVLAVILYPVIVFAQEDYLSKYEENKKIMLRSYPKENLSEAEFYFDVMAVATTLIGAQAGQEPSEEQRALGSFLYEKIKKQRPNHEEIKKLDELSQACKNEPAQCRDSVMEYNLDLAAIPNGKLTRLMGDSVSIESKGQGYHMHYSYKNKNSVVKEVLTTAISSEGMTVQVADGRTSVQIVTYKIGSPSEAETETYSFDGVLKAASNYELNAESDLYKKLQGESHQQIIRLFKAHENLFPSSVRASVLLAVYLAGENSFVQAHKYIKSAIKKFPNEILPQIILSGILRSARTPQSQRFEDLVKKRFEFIEENSR
ncbi:MAG: hypothetical protein KDD37_09460 [Bdellovibrionales bacterium]|nr:hypothetical protein [Bdellovibrionales bacterium]